MPAGRPVRRGRRSTGGRTPRAWQCWRRTRAGVSRLRDHDGAGPERCCSSHDLVTVCRGQVKIVEGWLPFTSVTSLITLRPPSGSTRRIWVSHCFPVPRPRLRMSLEETRVSY